MPYIDKKLRTDLLLGKSIKTPGELNYMVTRVLKRYLIDNSESYKTYNDMVGALECAKLELHRRLISNYENKKMVDNGDVW